MSGDEKPEGWNLKPELRSSIKATEVDAG